MIERRKFGRTGIEVSEIAFGAAEMGYENAGDATSKELLETALAGGINLIDTAECYADSEEQIGRHLAGRRREFCLLTKCGHASGLPGGDWNPAMLAASIDRSLQRLRTDHVDILLLHSCSADQLRNGGVVEPLVKAKQDGKARFIGYSGDGEAARLAAGYEAFDCLEMSVNIADQQGIDLVLPVARERGLGVIAKRSIANAAWKAGDRPPSEYARPYFERRQNLRYPFLNGDLRRAVSTALAFTLSAPGVDCAVMGTKSPLRLRENLEIAKNWRMHAGEYETIRARWKQVAEREWVGQT